MLRPWILENTTRNALIIFVNSLANFLEAVIGTLLLTGIAFQLRFQFPKYLGQLKEDVLYLLASFCAGVYTISQELKFHHLGGNNVFDPYDLVATVVGLFFAFLLIRKYGVVK